MRSFDPGPLVAIACGGTGGHLFPGIAVGEEILLRGGEVTLLVSEKEVDQQAVKSARDMRIVSLPAVGLTGGNRLAFLQSGAKSYQACRKLFAEQRPSAVLAMGGFTSAPPILAGRKCGAATFIHESNTIPGRANRLLGHLVDHVFVGFPEAAGRIHHPSIHVVGTPVRTQFQPMDAGAARMTLGLRADQPVLLVMGGSQGAVGINELVFQSLATLASRLPQLQLLHLTGARDLEKAKAAYAGCPLKAVVRPFLTEMEYALGAATLAVGRSGASSLAELAAMSLPSILIPYPGAMDNHQWHNARAYVETGAALILEQAKASPAAFAEDVISLLSNAAKLTKMRESLAAWHRPASAAKIADWMFAYLTATKATPTSRPNSEGRPGQPPLISQESLRA